RVSEAGEFRDDRVAHDQRGDQRGPRLVQRVVVGPHAQDDAERRAPDLPEDALLYDEARRLPVEILDGVHGVAHVLDGAIELLLRVTLRFAVLPHEELHDLGAPWLSL